MSEFFHISVLLQECIDGLNIKPDGIYVDGTLGGAGHSSQIAARLTTGRLIGIDRDPIALKAAGERLSKFGDRVTLVHSNFCEIPKVLDELGIEAVDGILLDLGVSSPQLDDGERGFSYMVDAPLDMRMNNGDALTAETIVNTWSYEELRRILYDYGEERYAPQIANHICKRREVAPIKTTLELVDVIRSAMPAAALREKQHPAKRSFQAIRIAVNDELGAVRQVTLGEIHRYTVDVLYVNNSVNDPSVELAENDNVVFLDDLIVICFVYYSISFVYLARHTFCGDNQHTVMEATGDKHHH